MAALTITADIKPEVVQNRPYKPRAADEKHTCLSRHMFYPVTNIPCWPLWIYIIIDFIYIYAAVNKLIGKMTSVAIWAGRIK